jgi:acetoin utilization protein AcuB
MTAVPAMSEVMTENPHAIGLGQTVRVAKDMMHEHGIRHLPVREGGKLLGLLSERDIHFALSIEDKFDFEMTVEDVYTPDPVIVPPTETLDAVVEMMATDRIGSVLVAEGEKLLGIYTTVDACQNFSQVLKESK